MKVTQRVTCNLYKRGTRFKSQTAQR